MENIAPILALNANQPLHKMTFSNLYLRIIFIIFLFRLLNFQKRHLQKSQRKKRGYSKQADFNSYSTYRGLILHAIIDDNPK
jgi:hypothetical protein